MKGTKLFDFLQTMTRYEMNRFHKYIHSPLFNEDGKIKHFVSSFLPYAKKNRMEDYKPKPSLPSAKYNRLLSDTVKKLEHFLVIDKFQQEQVLQHTYLMEVLNERALSKHFPEFAALTVKRQRQSPYRDAEFYYREFLIQQQQNFYIENKSERSIDKNLEQISGALDNFYLINKLKYAAALLHYKNFLSMEGEIPLFSELLVESAKQKYASIEALQLYKNIVLLFNEKVSDEAYFQLTGLLTKKEIPISTAEIKTALAFAINYCIQQINRGHQTFLNELLELYKHALQANLIIEHNTLSQWDYKNIATVAFRVKDFKWAEKFLEQYCHMLPRQERKNAYTFNIARYYFYVRKYDLVLQLLQEVEYSDIFYQLDAKTTLLKTYYELGEWQPLYSLKDSFRVLLRRKKLITPSQKENYMNLLQFTIRLFKTDVKNNKHIADIKRDILHCNNVADKSWLLEKLQELGV
jgi:hypothetical protein